MARFSAQTKPHTNHLKSKKGRARFSLFLYPFQPGGIAAHQKQCRILWILFVIYAVMGSSCSAFKFLGSPSRTWSSPEEIIEAYNENIYRLQTLKGKGFLLLESEEFNERGTAHVVIKMPDSLKVRLEGPLGVDVASFFLDSREILLYLHRDELVFGGRLDTLNFSQLLYDLTGFQLSDDAVGFQEIQKAIIGFFAGMSPLDHDNMIPVNFGDPMRKSTIFKVDNAASEIRFEFPANRELLQRVQVIDKTQEIRVEKRYSRYIKSKGVHIPRRIWHTFFQEKGRIALQYFQIQVNKSIQSDEFHIEIPPELRGNTN